MGGRSSRATSRHGLLTALYYSSSGHTILPLDPPPLDPPKSVFRLIDHRLHNDVGDKQSEAYGFNGGDEWEVRLRSRLLGSMD